MNITFSVADDLAESASRVAKAVGKDLGQLLRDYLEQISHRYDAASAIAELRSLSQEARGHSRGWRFDREELHDRP